MYQPNSCIKHFFFYFPSNFFTLSTWFLSCLTRLSLEFPVAFHSVFHLVSDYLFFILSWMQWMLVTVNKSMFSLWKTFSKISIWDMSCIRLSLLYEKHLLACCPLLPPLLSALRTWYVMFSQAKFQIAINMYHETFLQCVWIKSHSSSLTNEEKQIWSVSLDLL